MTNKEAVNLIIRNKSVFQHDKEMTEALDKAINALAKIDVIMPVVIFPSGEQIILTNGHIQALCDYEKEQMVKDIIERFMKGGAE